MAKRVAIYARVSTREQDPRMQLEALRELAARRGLEISVELVDHGVSGKKDSRPALNELMDLVRKRKVDGVLVYRFDRFARSVRHLMTALEEFEVLGCDFVSYSENVDTATPIGRAMFTILGAVAQLERDLIVERSVEGQRRARARGARIGRPRVTLDLERARALQASGGSFAAIARELGASKSTVARALGPVVPETPRKTAS